MLAEASDDELSDSESDSGSGEVDGDKDRPNHSGTLGEPNNAKGRPRKGLTPAQKVSFIWIKPKNLLIATKLDTCDRRKLHVHP